FYDYEAKYFRDDTRYFCPSGLSASAEAHLASLALAAFEAAGASGWGRSDFMMDAGGRPVLLEINTIPGMTRHSLVPRAERAAALARAASRSCDQPIETVALPGRFQRLAPVHVERAVKRTLPGLGLLSGHLAAVRRAIHKRPSVEAVSVKRFWPRALAVLV